MVPDITDTSLLFAEVPAIVGSWRTRIVRPLLCMNATWVNNIYICLRAAAAVAVYENGGFSLPRQRRDST